MSITTTFDLGSFRFVLSAGMDEFIIAPDINHTVTREAVIGLDDNVSKTLAHLFRDRGRIYEALKLEFAASHPISLNSLDISSIEDTYDRNPYLSDEAISQITQFLIDLWYDRPERTIPKEKYSGNNKGGWVYFLKDMSGLGLYKIGMTKREPDKRVQEFSPKLPFDTQIILAIETPDAYQLESEFHDMFSEYRTNGEWFELTEEQLNNLEELGGNNNG